MARRLRAQLISPTYGPLNPAYVDFSYSSATPTTAQLTAQTIAYLWLGMRQFSEKDGLLVGVEYQAAQPGPWLAVPFPTAEYAVLAAADPAIPVMTVYAIVPFGIPTGTSSGRGDSVCVNTRAPAAGKNGRGRHFLPFLSRDGVGTDGLLQPVSAIDTEAAYDAYILADGSIAPVVDGGAVVYSPTLGTSSTIVQGSVNRIPSRLRSRTR